MKIINVQEFEESFVIHFGSESPRINAYTLASTLVAFADAAKSANTIINPGYEIEIVVEALGSGSFRAKIRTAYKGLQNLWSTQEVKSVVLSLMASYIFQQTLAPDQDVKVLVDDNQVVIEQQEKKIIIPKIVHDALKEVEKSEKFKHDINRTFKAVEEDEKIKSFGITKKLDDEKPTFEISRDNFPEQTELVEEAEASRTIIEIADLQILRAILKRSRRKWEFVWRGVPISSPVLDDKFYNDFFAHKITIAPGDALSVKLRIYQTKDPDTGIYTNKKYEVIEVINLIQSPKQMFI